MSYLDECGFAPTQPTSYSWCLPGERKKVRYEDTKGRRVNALAVYAPLKTPTLHFEVFERTLTSADLLAFLRALPKLTVPRVIVLDNAQIHKSKEVKAALPELWRSGIFLFFLPPYSPRLNHIEPLFRHVKHNGLPERAYKTGEALKNAVQQEFDGYARRLALKTPQHPRLPA